MKLRTGLVLLVLMLIAPVARADHEDGVLWFSQVLEPGYVVTPFAVGAVPATAMAFAPDGDLYVTTLAGAVLRYRNVAGAIVAPPEPVAFVERPQGLSFAPDGTLYVSSVDTTNTSMGRQWGMVTRYAEPSLTSMAEQVLVDIPFGIHNNVGLRFGPDGKLYFGIASTSVNGDSPPGEAAEIFPITMAVLSAEVSLFAGIPFSVLRYRGSSAAVDDPIDVVATGIHNPYDITFRGDDLYTASNAPQNQEPLGEDVLVGTLDAPAKGYAAGTHDDFGSPGCLYTHDAEGWPVGGPSDYPSLPDDQETCEGRVPVTAALGLHRGATGLDVAPEGFGAFGGDVFVAEWGSLGPTFLVPLSGEPVPDIFPPFDGHKVVRVGLNSDGTVRAAEDGGPDIADFMVTTAPIDIAFHNGAMYVADFGTGLVLRVVPAT